MREIAELIGLYVSIFPASDKAPLHYRHLERFKNFNLNIDSKSWDSEVRLTNVCRKEIKWWIKNIFSNKFQKSLEDRIPQIKLHTDSSNIGWGSYLKTDKVEEANWRFLENQLHYSINNKELMAVRFALEAYRHKLKNHTVQILTDNSTALSCLLRKGSQDCFRDIVTRKIYKITCRNKIILIPIFIPGKINPADRSSRKFNELCEWSLAEETMEII